MSFSIRALPELCLFRMQAAEARAAEAELKASEAEAKAKRLQAMLALGGQGTGGEVLPRLQLILCRHPLRACDVRGGAQSQ